MVSTCVQARACQTRICKESALPFHSRRSNDCLIGRMSGHRTCRRGGAAFAKPKHSSSFRATSSQPVTTSSQLCRTDGSRLPTCSQRPSSVAAAFMACKASSSTAVCHRDRRQLPALPRSAWRLSIASCSTDLVTPVKNLAMENRDGERERDHVFIGNQREQLQKEPARANLPLPSPLMFWGRCLSVDFEGIWGRC